MVPFSILYTIYYGVVALYYYYLGRLTHKMKRDKSLRWFPCTPTCKPCTNPFRIYGHTRYHLTLEGIDPQRSCLHKSYTEPGLLTIDMDRA